MKKITVDIAGMHCRSCEIILEKDIGNIDGVRKVRTDHKKGLAVIECDAPEPDMGVIESAIRAAGYSVGKGEKKHFFSHNLQDYSEILIAGAVLFVLYLILNALGIFSLSPDVGSAPGLLGVLLIGLTAGVSTCMALIGGLVLGISSRYAETHPAATAVQKFRPHLFFNLGRLVSYAVLGGIIGLLGSVLKISSSVLGLLTLALGIVMLVLGLKLTELFPRMSNKGFALPTSVAKLFGLHQGVTEYSHGRSFVTGALTFFVPCGFTQAMQLYAVSTGSFAQGALIMGTFALGTLPGILGIGGLTSAIKGSFARHFFKFAGLVVVILALWNIQSGFRLSGLHLPSFVSSSVSSGYQQTQLPDSGLPIIEDGKQVVDMTQSGGGYSPRQFTIKKGIPVVWKIRSTTQYTCAAYINMPAAGISQPLKAGENVIEFTPAQAGVMQFTCSMGMYSGVFNVTD
jgi:uncharacterized protein